jgi:hypothetical protein
MILVAGLLILGAAVFAAADQGAAPGEEMWFDLENCAFCKHLSKDPQLMQNMMWEHHDISNGAVTIVVVNPGGRKAYMEAEAGMAELSKKMETGEINPADVPMCGHCKHYGKLMEMGAKIESVQSKLADVTIMTSDKPEVVAEIKTFAQRNRDEMAKMEMPEKAQKMEQMQKMEQKVKKVKKEKAAETN